MTHHQVASFDIWKTLVTSNPAFKPAREAYVGGLLGVQSGQDAADFALLARQVDVATDAESDTTGEQFGPAIRIKRIATALGKTVSDTWADAVATEVQELFLAYPLIHNEPELLETLDAIRQSGKKIVLTSNTGFIDGRFMRPALKKVGILPFTNQQFFSDEVGVAKPNPIIFNTVAQTMNVSNEAVVHIGDNINADYRGARAVGMGALLVSQTAYEGITTYPTIKAAHIDGAV